MADETTTGVGGAYDVPDISEVYTPEQADSIINKLNAAWTSDEHHPINNLNHLQNAEFQNVMTELHRIKFADADQRSPLEKAMAEGLEIQAEQEAERATAAQAAIDELGQYGWDTTFDINEIEGGPVLPHELQCLETLLCVERDEYDGNEGAMAKFDKLMSQYPHAPHEVRENLAKLKDILRENAADTFNEKRTLSLKILQTMRDYGRKKLGLEPRPDIRGDYEDEY